MDFISLAQQCAPMVAPSTLAAIIRTESSFKPFAIGINGGARLVRQPVNKAEAVVTASWLIERGYNIDMGLGQINSKNLAKLNYSVDDVFDECKNLAAMATILGANYTAAKSRTSNDQSALHAALSMYNTGNITRGFSNGYVQKVLNNASGRPLTISSVTTTTNKMLDNTARRPQVDLCSDPSRSWDVYCKKTTIAYR